MNLKSRIEQLEEAYGLKPFYILKIVISGCTESMIYIAIESIESILDKYGMNGPFESLEAAQIWSLNDIKETYPKVYAEIIEATPIEKLIQQHQITVLLPELMQCSS